MKIVENTETDIETDDDYYIEYRQETASTIKFVDLAGSDRHGKLLNAEGDKMFDQTDINASIDSFQHMLKIVSQNNTVNAHKPLPVPFRNSLLTKNIERLLWWKCLHIHAWYYCPLQLELFGNDQYFNTTVER